MGVDVVVIVVIDGWTRGVVRADLDVCSGSWMGVGDDGQGGRLGG
jgi:hypothetical protein